MSSHIFRSVGLTPSGRKTAMAVAVVAVLLFSGMSVMVFGESGSETGTAAVSDTQTVTYYYSESDTTKSYDVTYYGIASSEYNPEYWKDTVDGTEVENWTGGNGEVPVSGGTYKLSLSGLSLRNSTVISLDPSSEYTLGTDSISGSYRTSGSRTYWYLDCTYSETDKTITLSPRSSSYSSSQTGSGTINLTVPSGTMSISKVFGGWTDGTNEYLPGDILPSDVTALYAKWIIPDVFTANTSSTISVPISNNSGSFSPVSVGLTLTVSSNKLLPYSSSNYSGYNITSGDGSSIYGRIYYLSAGTTYYINGVTLPTGTYRSSDVSNPAILHTSSGTCTLSGAVAIDNVYLAATSAGNTHGDANTGIVADGNVLVIGTGVTSNQSGTVSYYSNSIGPQIVGGSVSGTLSGSITKSMVFHSEGTGGGTKSLSVSLATCVIIHSGIYFSVVAGSVGYNIGSTSSPASTYLVMKGGTVLDTLVGGNGSSGHIYGAGTSDHDTAKADKELQGGTFVYMLGADLPGDNYIDGKSGFSDYRTDRSDYTIEEASILEGGSSNSGSAIYGSTHVFLSDDTTVFDAQASGRRGATSCSYAYMEITGKAVVRHIACGTITDGISDSSGKQCASGVGIVVGGNAQVATLCGGGYDTWTAPNGPSMKSGDIDISIVGGTVGYVYGGGFRGTLGTSSTPVNITITVTGGTILHDVYGGGRGGIEKILHNSDGTKSSTGDGFNDSTGKSYVYGNTKVTIGGGEGSAVIKGSVYGGGESVPWMKSYAVGGSTYSFSTRNSDVAMVAGTSSVEIKDGADVKGSVYGSGRGIAYNSSGSISDADKTEYSTMYLYTYSTSGFGPENVAWMSSSSGDGTATYYTKSEQGTSFASFAKVDGSSGTTSSVTVFGGSVAGNVYGGGAYGITNTSSSAREEVIASVAVSGGTIGGSVFGGGVGTAGDISVYGSTKVEMSGGTVAGSVYGGSHYGVIRYNTELVMTGGIVTGSVYGGGYGVVGSVSVNGTRKTTLKNISVTGSVYGGSSLGTDGSSSSTASHAYVFVCAGTSIGESVYGGGFQGTTYGGTEIYIGYEWDSVSSAAALSAESGSVTVKGSVYAGGDVGVSDTSSSAYTAILVYGGGTVKVDGSKLEISISGSIMASGNSCLTDGNTSIELKNFSNKSEMEGIHRADTLLLDNSSVVLNGRGTVHNGESNIYSIFGIENDLKLQNGSKITLYSSVENIGSYSSLNKDGSATLPTSPLNTIVFGAGNSFIVRDTDGTSVTYGKVSGYTVIAVATSDSLYGAYALGSLDSAGGFVIGSGGTYKEADSTDYSSCRCWFISGTKSTDATLTLNYPSSGNTASTETSVNMPKLLGTTSVRYTGGVFIESGPGTAEFVGSDASAQTETGKYSVLTGYGSSGSGRMLIDTSSDGSGVYGDGVYFDPDATVSRSTSFEGLTPDLWVKFSGCIENRTQYLGYVLLYFQEVSSVEYDTSSGTETIYVITNYSEVRLNLYVQGSDTTLTGDYSVSLGTIRGSGTADFYIPAIASYSGATVYVTGMEAVEVPTYGAGTDSVTVSASKNLDNTNGWTVMNGARTYAPGESQQFALGVIQGAFIADMHFSVTGFDYGDPNRNATYKFTMNAVLQDGTSFGFTVSVHVSVIRDVIVTFVDGQRDYSIDYTFEYGRILGSTDCPPNGENFIGWYTDVDYNNIYNYKVPLTRDITLYARYTITVTFDNCDGTSSILYLEEQAGGVSVPRPGTDPERAGYAFGGWYQDAKYTVAWDFDGAKTSKNITLYAKWTGVEIGVTFQYTDSSGTVHTVEVDGAVYSFTVNYGNKFGVVDVDHSSAGNEMTYLSKAREVVSSSITEEFIRWSVTKDDQTVSVYDDTLVPFWNESSGKYYLVLTAVTSAVALQVTMDANTDDQAGEVNPPSEYLVYPGTRTTDSIGTYYPFSFDLNGAVRTGYNLQGWAFSKDATDDYVGAGTSVELHIYFTEETSSGKTVYTISKIAYADGTDTGLAAGEVLNDPKNPFNITYYAVWEQIEYTVNVLSSAGGVIDAWNSSGDHGTSFTVYYGDTITLRFTSNPGYEFYSWYLNGEGKFKDSTEKSSSTTLEVTGNCSVYAVSTGPQVVKVTVYFNGGEQITGSVPEVMFKGKDGTEDLTMTVDRWEQDSDGKYYAYYWKLVPRGAYDIGLVGTSGNFSSFDTLTVNDEVYSASLNAFTVTNNIKVGTTDETASESTGLESYTEFLKAGSDMSITLAAGYFYDVNAEYEVSDGTTVTNSASGTTTSKQTPSFTVRLDISKGMILSGSITIADRNIIVHVYRMDIGGTAWSYYETDTKVMETAQSEYTGTYNLAAYPGFSLDVAKSETASAITSFSVSGGVLTFTLDAGKTIELYYGRLTAEARVVVDSDAEVSDMTGWTESASGDKKVFTKTVWFGETVTLPTVTKTDCELEKWVLTGCTGTLTSDYKYTVVAGDVSDSESKTIEFTANLLNDIHILTLVTQYGTFSNGSSRYSVKVKVGETLQKYLETPTLSASETGKYKFGGWKDLADTMPDEDVTYTAVWTVTKLTLTFKSGDDPTDNHVGISATSNSVAVSSGASLGYGDYVIVTIVFDEGYSLGSYTPSGTAIGAPVQGSDSRHYTWAFYITDTEDISVTSTKASLKIRFAVDGTVDETLTMGCEKYGTYYFNQFSKPGYRTTGWYTDAACTVEAAESPDQTKGYYAVGRITEDLTFYTKSDPNEYYVAFDGNGADGGATETQTFRYGTAQGLTFNGFVYDGHKFVGWAVSASGVLKYTDGESVSDLTSADGATYTLYAVWVTENSISAKYDGENHSASVTMTKSGGTPLTVYYATVNLTASNYSVAGSTEKIGYRDVNVSGGAVVPYTVYYYAIAQSENGSAAVSGSLTVTVTAREVTITSGDATRSWIEGTPLTNDTRTYGGDGFVAGEGVELNFTGSQTDVGSSENTFTYTFTGVTKSGNYTITAVYGTLTVTEATTDITVDKSFIRTYGDGVFNLNATTTHGALKYKVSIGTGVVSVDASGNITILSAGSATVNVYIEETVFYKGANVDVSITIDPKVLTVSGIAIISDREYDGTTDAAFDDSGKAINGIVSGDEGKVDVTVKAVYDSKNAGSRTISMMYAVTGEKASDYTVADPASQAGTITPRTITLISDSAEKVYDGTALTKNSYTLKDGKGFPAGEGIRSMTYSGTQTNVGSSDNGFTYVLSTGTEASNYTISLEFGELTVTTLYISVPVGKSCEYTGRVISATSAIEMSVWYTITGSGKDLGEYTAVLNLNDTSNTCWKLSDGSTSTADQDVKWRIVMVKLDFTKFTVDTASVVYRATEYTEADKAITVAPVSETDPTPIYVKDTDYTVTFTDNLYAGTATITIDGIGGYGGSQSWTFTIAKRTAYMVADSSYKVYDGTALSADGYSYLGFISSDLSYMSVTVSGSQTTPGSAVNRISVYVNSADVGNSYDFVLIDGTLAVFESMTSSVTSGVKESSSEGTTAPAEEDSGVSDTCVYLGAAAAVLAVLSAIILIRRRCA